MNLASSFFPLALRSSYTRQPVSQSVSESSDRRVGKSSARANQIGHSPLPTQSFASSFLKLKFAGMSAYMGSLTPQYSSRRRVTTSSVTTMTGARGNVGRQDSSAVGIGRAAESWNKWDLPMIRTIRTSRTSQTSRTSRTSRTTQPMHWASASALTPAAHSASSSRHSAISSSAPAISKPKLQYTGSRFSRVGRISSSVEFVGRDGLNADKPQLLSALSSSPPPPPPISKSDEDFLDQLGIEFVWTTDELGVDELNNLFSQVGFPRRDPTRLAAALQNTHRSLWVRAARKSRLAKEGQLLAFGRATSDGALSATIWDVAVLPSWQRGGIGRGLVERLTRSIVEEGIPVVTLYAEPGVVGLYEKLGFEVDAGGVKGLAFQSKSVKGRRLVASVGG